MKKYHLSKTQREILFCLSEAHEEDITTLINTVSDIFPIYSRHEILMSIEKALRDLCKLQLIEINVEDYKSNNMLQKVENNEVTNYLSISRHVVWDSAESIWRWNSEGTNLIRPVIVLTEKGIEALKI